MNDITPDPARTVVVGVDPTESAREAALWAADLAADRAAPLHLVHVGPAAGLPGVAPPRWLMELRDAAQRAGAHPVTIETAAGTPADVLVARVADAGLLVVGSYGDQAWSGMLAGALALHLLDRAPCPVAVVRGAAVHLPPPRGGAVVVGVDGSPAGDAALVTATDLAADLGARLTLVHTVTDVGPDATGAARRHHDAAALEAAGEALLDDGVTVARARRAGIVVDRHLAVDTPLRALVERAPGARMIIVGSRAQRPERGMLLGSTSRGLVEFAPCPVVVVPDPRAADTRPRDAAATGSELR